MIPKELPLKIAQSEPRRGLVPKSRITPADAQPPADRTLLSKHYAQLHPDDPEAEQDWLRQSSLRRQITGTGLKAGLTVGILAGGVAALQQGVLDMGSLLTIAKSGAVGGLAGVVLGASVPIAFQAWTFFNGPSGSPERGGFLG